MVADNSGVELDVCALSFCRRSYFSANIIITIMPPMQGSPAEKFLLRQTCQNYSQDLEL